MKDLLEYLKKRLAEEETIRCLKFLALPFLAVILIIVIVAADRPQKGQEAESAPAVMSSETGPEAETEEAIEKTEENAYRLEEAGEEIHDLMETYFKARRTCDGNTLQKVYGDSASPEDLQKERLRMEEEVKYYQSYSDLVCYSTQGPEADTLVVYTTFMVKFRQADTLAPSMFACLVKQGADGSWYMAATITPEEEAYMNRVNESDRVQTMVKAVNSELREALESDSNLLSVYDTLMSGGAPKDGEAGNASAEGGEPASISVNDGESESADE